MLTISQFEGAIDEWDAFVAKQHDATHCHGYAWRGVIEKVFGHPGLYLAARDESGALAGVLPAVRMRSVLFGRQIVSMPFLNYGGPLGTPDAISALTAEVTRYGERERARLVELRSRVQLQLDIPTTRNKVTVTLQLSPGESDGLWKRLPSNVRNQVRKPMKAGVTMRFGADQVFPFYTVFARNMRDLGTPTHTLRLFEEVQRAFGDDAWFGCAYIGDLPVAGGCAVVFGKEIEMVWGSALREYNRSHAPNMLMYWSFMERACTAGLEVFNFGRSTPGEGTHRFKQQWGTHDEPLWWYGAGPAVASAAAAQESRAEKWGPLFWKRLPLSVANRIGPFVRRGIAA